MMIAKFIICIFSEHLFFLFVKEDKAKSWMAYIAKSLTKIWEFFVLNRKELSERSNV